MLIYALGGGWGHLTRAASLARVAPGHRVRILTNSPYAMRVAKAMPELELIALDPSLGAAETRLRAVREIEAGDCGCLIVDTFPRGLGGELAGVLGSVGVAKVLIHRDLNPRYIAEAGLRGFVRSNYDLILLPGEGSGFADLPSAVVTRPWVIRDPQPRRGGGILVCASGEASELAWYGAVVGCLHPAVDVRCVAPVCPPGCPRECWIEYWPAADLYPEADVVVGGAGYNTIHECAAWGIPLIARPWPRTYDRQWLRARRAAKSGAVTVVGEPREAADAAVRELRLARGLPVGFQNGAGEAMVAIERVKPRRFQQRLV